MENKITYKQIKEANDSTKTTDIKGKEYTEVNQRIKAYRMVYPNGSITTEILKLEDGVVLMKATILNEDGVVIGTGLAQEKEDSTFINKTSYIENCETSAVGRALGMCGFGIDTSVASAEEVKTAMANQEPKQDTKKTTKKNEINEVVLLKAQKLNIKLEDVATYFKKKVTELTNEEVVKAIDLKEKQIARLKEKQAKQGEEDNGTLNI